MTMTAAAAEARPSRPATGKPKPATDAALKGERRLIRIEDLFVSKLNVRKHGSKDVDTLAASIAAQGQLQPLLVRPAGTKFEIAAGQRRWLALGKLKAAKHPGAGMAECIVRDMTDAEVIEASLAENIEREPMDPMDEHEAFAALAKEGMDEAAIATHFGVTRQLVKRRMALGSLIPDIGKLYRAQKIDDKELQLLTLATKDKQKEYAGLVANPKGNPPPYWQLKAWLLGGAEIPVKAALFPLESYKGAIASDLFEQGRYFADPTAFWELQNAAIAERKAELEAAGWTVDLLDPQNPFRDWQYERLAKDKGGRAVIAVTANGEVATHKGVIHRDALARMQKARKATGKDGTAAANPGEADSEEEAQAERAELTQSLENYIELVRHSAVRASLIEAPKTALRAAVAQIIAGSTHWRIAPEPRRADSNAIAQATAPLPGNTAFAEARAAAHKLVYKKAGSDGVPEDDRLVHQSYASRAALIYQRLTELDDAEVLKLLAVAVAETLAVGTQLIDRLGSDLEVDVLAGWRPDEALFSLVRDKEALTAMLTEVAGKDTAHAYLTATSAKKKDLIRNALAQKGGTRKDTWKPRWMAFPQGRYTKRRLTLREKPDA